jgi:hypothetical protein
MSQPAPALDLPDPAPLNTDDTARTRVLRRAQDGALLSPADICLIFEISTSSYHRHAIRGDFDAFLVKGPRIGVRKYSGALVWRYLQGEDPTRTFAAPRGSRR